MLSGILPKASIRCCLGTQTRSRQQPTSYKSFYGPYCFRTTSNGLAILSRSSSPTAGAINNTALRQPHICCAASNDINASYGNNLPITPVQMIEQAASAVSTGISGNLLRQQIDFLLPINEKERRFTATEPDDYPCSLQREFEVACSLTTAMLQRVLNDPTVEIIAKRLDDGGVEGEPCAVLYPKDSKSIAAVVYPTADRLNQIKELAKTTTRPLLIVNKQWNEAGQVISDFGIGPWKAAAYEFLNTFKPTYVLKEKRIGSPGTINGATGMRFTSGGVIRVLRAFPQKEGYELFAMSADGSSQLLETSLEEPSYQDLDAMITEGRRKKLEIFSIAQKATAMFEPRGEDDDKNDEEENEEEKARVTKMSDADIDALDAASLRRLLASYGQPTSGKLSKLKERLKEAQQQNEAAV
jgi:Domain of unknown function (DUF1995)